MWLCVPFSLHVGIKYGLHSWNGVFCLCAVSVLHAWVCLWVCASVWGIICLFFYRSFVNWTWTWKARCAHPCWGDTALKNRSKQTNKTYPCWGDTHLQTNKTHPCWGDTHLQTNKLILVGEIWHLETNKQKPWWDMALKGKKEEEKNKQKNLLVRYCA